MNSSSYLLCTAIAVTGFSHSVQADTKVEAGLGVVGAHLTYEESGVRHNGYLSGVGGYIALHNKWMLRLQGSYIAGDDIHYASSTSGSMSGMQDKIFEIRGLVGGDMERGKGRITPYTGLGYRYLVNKSAYMYTSLNKVGYDREQDYFYWPVGLLYAYPLAQGWQLSTQLEYDLLLRGDNTTKLGTIPGYHDLKFRQTSGYGGQLAVTIKKTWPDKLISGIALSPYVKYWDIEASNVNQGYYEPSNSTTEFGIQLALTY